MQWIFNNVVWDNYFLVFLSSNSPILLCLRNLPTSRVNNDWHFSSVNKKLSLGKKLKKHPLRVIRFWQHQRKVRDIIIKYWKNCGKRLNFSNWDSKISISCHASSFFFCPIHFFKNSLHEWVFEWMTSSPHFGTNRLIFYRSWIATRQLIWGLVDYLLLYSAHAGGDKQI